MDPADKPRDDAKGIIMIIAYSTKNKFLPITITSINQNVLQEALWIDMFNPTKEEEKIVEAFLHLEVPTRAEMEEIEFSSRLYAEDNGIFMTVTMVAQSDTLAPKSDPVTLILTQDKFVTLRYIEPRSFGLFISRMTRNCPGSCTAERLLVELLDASIDRLADILEQVSHGLDLYSQNLFHEHMDTRSTNKPDFKKHLQELGFNGDLCNKIQESLVSYNRLVAYYGQNEKHFDKTIQTKLIVLTKDILSLSDYATFLDNKVNFLLNATLGMVNIEQNNIIKIFSIAAVILLPPTLVASIYGMNFKVMPELYWRWGYPFAIFMMVIAAWLPYKYFKIKKWL